MFLRGAAAAPLPSERAAVAIVGARRPTDAGLRLARRLGAFAAGSGLAVVSGMALGIDGAAHAGALDAGGFTIAVLGCGTDIAYPRSHRGLYARILEHGLAVSEYPPGTAPAPWRFPARNRLIAALAGTLVVVEARARSGALITADHALDLGRDVVAVPGAAGSSASAGTNGLIKAGAGLVEDEADLAAWLGVDQPEAPQPPADSVAQAVLERLSGRPAYADDVADARGHGARLDGGAALAPRDRRLGGARRRRPIYPGAVMDATRWATFDCYGTLIDWNGGIRATLARLFGAAEADALLRRYHELEPQVQAERYRTYREVLDLVTGMLAAERDDQPARPATPSRCPSRWRTGPRSPRCRPRWPRRAAADGGS